jgi:hypothetical protein
MIKRQHTKATYQCCILTIEAACTRGVFQQSLLGPFSAQSHLGKLFKSRTFMVDICK